MLAQFSDRAKIIIDLWPHCTAFNILQLMVSSLALVSCEAVIQQVTWVWCSTCPGGNCTWSEAHWYENSADETKVSGTWLGVSLLPATSTGSSWLSQSITLISKLLMPALRKTVWEEYARQEPASVPVGMDHNKSWGVKKKLYQQHFFLKSCTKQEIQLRMERLPFESEGGHQ